MLRENIGPAYPKGWNSPRSPPGPAPPPSEPHTPYSYTETEDPPSTPEAPPPQPAHRAIPRHPPEPLMHHVTSPTTSHSPRSQPTAIPQSSALSPVHAPGLDSHVFAFTWFNRRE